MKFFEIVQLKLVYSIYKITGNYICQIKYSIIVVLFLHKGNNI